MGTGGFSRRKGKRGERLTATDLREAFLSLAEEIRRGWQTRAGQDDPDIKFPGVWIENKYGAKPNVRAALAQAVRDSNGGEKGVPIAVIRDNRGEPFVVLRWSDFLHFLRKTAHVQFRYVVRKQRRKEKGKCPT